MKRVVSALTGVLFVAAMVAPLVADVKTVKGEIVDVQCQAKKAENTGADHEGCAKKCAEKGAKMGILAADGVYTITGDYAADNNKKLLEFVAKKVEATGDVTEKDGQKTIKVASMKASN
jgi:flagellar hook assembly protein FlgD